MDNEGIRQMGAAVGEAMAGALAASERAKEERRAELKEERRGLAAEEDKHDRVQSAMRAVADAEKRAVGRGALAAGRNVSRYLRAVRKEAVSEMGDHLLAGGGINYIERYDAFLRMDDRKQLLTRIQQTIMLAQRALDAAPGFDPQSLAQGTADVFRHDAAALASVVVAPLEGEDSEEPSDSGEGGSADEDRMEQMCIDTAQEVFERLTGMGLGPTDEEVSEQKLEDEIRLAIEETEKAIADRRRQEALRVAGASLETTDIPLFEGKLKWEFAYPVQEVQELLDQVQLSFATYSQIVADNGLFAAFVKDGKYGSTVRGMGYWNGWWELDDCCGRMGSSGGQGIAALSIPMAVDAEDGDDSPGYVAQRMKRFNAKKYFGLLDDDFTEHVDAFWFGFAKLMEFSNGLCSIDFGPLRDYFQSIERLMDKQARNLGSRMAPQQLEKWAEDIAALAVEVESREA